MPFRRTANAIVSKTAIEFEEWMEELRQQHEGAVSRDYVGRIAKDVLRRCDPKQYLLSHATIVASVDTYSPKGAKTGRRMERGCQIDVRHADYRIKPECQDIINNNGDAWERSLLLSTYKTFIGAPNYLEHVQIPELSKGFIVDAIARDLGNTCYVDILVATDRKHRMLIQDILAGQISAMSMGCISLFTVCTRCGNVAVDDTQLCPHVLYDGKGTKFLDEENVEHRLAELIGHVSIPNSNQFIEASWVRNPAFRGAQRRNILNPDSSALAGAVSRAAEVYELRREIPDPDGLRKVASGARTAQDEPAEKDPPDEPDPGSEADELDSAAEKDPAEGEAEKPPEPEKPAEAPKEKLDELIGKAQELLVETLVKDLERRVSPKPEDVETATPSALESGADLNETLLTSSEFDRLVRSAFRGHPRLVEWAVSARRSVSRGQARLLSPRDLIVLSWIDDTARSAACPPAVYQVAMSVGPSRIFPSEVSYLAACRVRLGRALTASESSSLVRIGRIASTSEKF